MRAAVLHAPGDLRIEAVAEPEPGPGEVVMDIGAALSCGTDVKSVLRGHPSIAAYPSRLGHEFAGVVAAVGAGVRTVSPGDRVFCGNSAPCGVCRACVRGRESLCEDLLYLLGGFAEQVLVPQRIVERNRHRVPDGLELQTAARRSSCSPPRAPASGAPSTSTTCSSASSRSRPATPRARATRARRST